MEAPSAISLTGAPKSGCVSVSARVPLTYARMAPGSFVITTWYQVFGMTGAIAAQSGAPSYTRSCPFAVPRLRPHGRPNAVSHSIQYCSVVTSAPVLIHSSALCACAF
jgi:hypothetical protein